MSKKTIFCRHCFELFRADRIGVICRSRSCARATDDRGRRRPRYLDPRKYPALWRGFRRRLELDVPCPICAEIDTLAPACPLCRHQLEVGLEDVTDRVIAVIGASESGKSHYLATLLHQLLEGGVGGDVWRVSMKPADLDHYRRRFVEPLYRNHRELDATPIEPGPELRLVVDGRGGRTLVIFRDLGGEAFLDRRQLERHGFLRYAQGVVLMVDPFAFPPPAGDAPSWTPNGQATCVEILERYREVLRSLPRYPEHRALPLLPEQKALAVALTKSDLLFPREHELWGDGDGRHLDAGFWHDRRERSDAVRDWLRERFGPDLGDAADAFGEVGYFVVSSYGYPPHTPHTPLAGPPRPRRVHEPLFGLLDVLAAGDRDGERVAGPLTGATALDDELDDIL